MPSIMWVKTSIFKIIISEKIVPKYQSKVRIMTENVNEYWFIAVKMKKVQFNKKNATFTFFNQHYGRLF